MEIYLRPKYRTFYSLYKALKRRNVKNFDQSFIRWNYAEHEF